MSIALEVSDEALDAIAERVEERLAEKRRWTGIEGVADHLGQSVRFVRYLRSRGLPADRIGKRLVFDLRKVDAWLENRGWED